MTDGFIQTPADNAGKRVDAKETTNTLAQTVYQLRMDVPEGVTVRGDQLELLLLEITATNVLIAQAFGLDLEDIRRSVGTK
jgi:hypothetical protein